MTITITSAETSTYAPATVKVKVKVSKKSIKECNLIFMKTGSISDSESDDYIAIADGTTILKEDVDYTRSTAGASFSSSNTLTSAYIKVTGKGNYTGIATLKSSAISATSVLNSAYRTTSGVKLTWKKETGAMGYRIYRKKGSASGYDKTGKTTVRLTIASLSSVKNSSSKSMTVKWSKKSGVTGYQIQYCASSSFASGSKTVTVSGASATSKTIGSLTKGKTYYVRIRTYKTVSGTKYYSAWSASKSVKISK